MNWDQMAALLTALGAGTAIGNYMGAGKARREVRSAVLEALAAAEHARWAIERVDYEPFRTAARDLQTAALIARIPRPAIQQYVLLADAAWRYSGRDFHEKEAVEELNPGAVDRRLADVVQEFAEVITQLAWRPWWSRFLYRIKLAKLRDEAARIDDVGVKRSLAQAQFALGRQSGSLGEIFDDRFPKRL